jgi:ubiquitin-protein ligase
MQEHLPPGISIFKAENLEEWQMDIEVLDDNPLYRGETYRLKFTFGSRYPIGTYTPHHTLLTFPALLKASERNASDHLKS